jgi:hypothetical protein
MHRGHTQPQDSERIVQLGQHAARNPALRDRTVAARAPLYGQAHHVIDTSRVDVEGAVADLVRELRA